MARRWFICLPWLLASVLGTSCAGESQQPGAAATVPATESEYRIGPGDQLTIFVFNHPELSGPVPVRPDGMISIPLAEDVTASGNTPTQLARQLETRLSEFVRTPKVNVIVTGFKGSLEDQIRVVGAAAKPQSLPYRANMTVLDVIIEVGGLGPYAAGNRARIIRNVNGKSTEIKVRLADLISDGDMAANIAVQPGDVLIIPETRF